MERERVKNEKLHMGAGLLQRQYRGFAARKEVSIKRREREGNAVDVLQRGGRVFIARNKVDGERKRQIRERNHTSAFIITKFFRFVAGLSAGKRIRDVTLKFVREAKAVYIQCFVRRCLAYRRVRRSLHMKRHALKMWSILMIQRIVRGYVGRCRAARREEETLKVPEIFAKVRVSDEEGVEHFITYQDHEDTNRSMPNDTDHNGDTVLNIAASKGLLRVMRKCLVWGTDPNLKNNDGLTAIDIAVRRYQPVAAEYLLSKISVKFSTDGLTLLHEASTSGMGRFALSLLENGVNANCRHPITGRTPTHDAACAALREGAIYLDNLTEEDEDFDEEEQNVFATKHAIVIQHLLDNGADILLTDNRGFTPLHYAAEVGNVACIQNMVKSAKGMECLAMKDPQGRSPWVIATLNSHTQAANMLWEHAIDMDNEVVKIHPDDATLFAVGLTAPDTTKPRTYRKKLLAIDKFDADARAESIKRLVTWAKIPIDAVFPSRKTTAVMLAAKSGNFAAFETALRMGAGLSRQDDNGRNALHFLCGTHDTPSSVSMLELCLNGPSDENVASADQDMEHATSMVDSSGRLPIHYAAFRSNAEVVTILHERGYEKCNVHSTDNLGNTPLHYICRLNDFTYKEMTKTLGFDSTMDQSVIPPGDGLITSSIRALRKLGANPEVENAQGKSPMMVACELGNCYAVRCLLADWKDVKDIAKSLVYMAHYAIKFKKLDCLREVCKHEKFTAAHAHSTGPDGISLLGTAIRANDVDVLNYLLEEVQINPTKQCWNGGGNALHACGLWGDGAVVEIIIKHPKMVPVMFERKNSDGNTPLLCAVASRNYNACIQLLKRGCVATQACKMWCASFLLNACMSQEKVGKAALPNAMKWRNKKFFVYGLLDVTNLQDIAAPTDVVGGTKKKQLKKPARAIRGGSAGKSREKNQSR